MTPEVIIVGAGPVGLTMALLLARHGVRVELLERRAEPCDEPRAVSIDDEALRIWQACGVLPALREDIGAGEVGQVICSYVDASGREFLGLRQRVSELGHVHAAAIHQGRIEAKLRRLAGAEAGVVLRCGVRVTGVAQDDGVVCVAGDQDGMDRRWSAPWVVACDGARSAVRGALGIPMLGSCVTRPWLVANLEDDGPRGHVVIRCDAEGAAVTMPLPHGLRRVEAELVEGAEGLLEDEAALRRVLSRGWAGAARARIVTRAVCRFSMAMAARWRDGRVFLAGDAAHTMPPFAGQGLCAGLRDAANLAFKIAGVQQGWLHEAALDSYEVERRPHVARVGRLSVRLGALMSPRSRGVGWVQRGVLRLVSPVRERLSLRGPGLQPVLRAGMVARGAGRYLPQPTVETRDRRHAMLDELLGPRMTWIRMAGGHSTPGVDPAGRGRGRRSSDRWLVEGRDFHDHERVLQRAYGAGSLVLVRPDRVVCAHLRPGAWTRGLNGRTTWDTRLAALREPRALGGPC